MPKEKSLTTILLTGDVMLGRLVDEYVLQDESLDPSYVWGNALPLFQKADLRLINLECVIAKSGERWVKTPKAFHFRASPRAIESLKTAKINFVSLANNHVGPNWGKPLLEIQALANQLIDLGVDFYWGHSNHTSQGIEVYQRGKIICYSMGDFIDDYAVDSTQRNDLSFLFELKLIGKKAARFTLYPTQTENFQANLIKGPETVFSLGRMRNLSLEFDTKLSEEDQVLILTV